MERFHHLHARRFSGSPFLAARDITARCLRKHSRNRWAMRQVRVKNLLCHRHVMGARRRCSQHRALRKSSASADIAAARLLCVWLF